MRRLDVLSAAAALLFVATAAQAQRGRGDQRGRQDQHQDQHQDQRQQPAPQAQPRQGGGWRGGDAQQRGDDRARDDQARAEQARGEQQRAEQARAAEENQRRAAQQNEQWRDQQNRQAQQQEQAERARQAQQREEQFERERQTQANRAYDRDRDRDFRDNDRDRDVRVIHDYRYNIRGVYRQTNQFGADVLRQAVDRGYDEGYRAGLNDRRDGERSDYQRALDFESGSFGYAGGYVPADDYSYYFREGFQRGYDDGYWSRSNYGTFSNGKAAILGAVALGILGLTMIH